MTLVNIASAPSNEGVDAVVAESQLRVTTMLRCAIENLNSWRIRQHPPLQMRISHAK